MPTPEPTPPAATEESTPEQTKELTEEQAEQPCIDPSTTAGPEQTKELPSCYCPVCGEWTRHEVYHDHCRGGRHRRRAFLLMCLLALSERTGSFDDERFRVLVRLFERSEDALFEGSTSSIRELNVLLKAWLRFCPQLAAPDTAELPKLVGQEFSAFLRTEEYAKAVAADNPDIFGSFAARRVDKRRARAEANWTRSGRSSDHDWQEVHDFGPLLAQLKMVDPIAADIQDPRIERHLRFVSRELLEAGSRVLNTLWEERVPNGWSF